jgi:hypothetical protein
VVDYSGLKMTFPKDRLPALAAVVQRMIYTRRDDPYIAGMWKSSLFQDLVWECSNLEDVDARPPTPVPTWSWASVSGAVYYNNDILSYTARLLHVDFTPTGSPQLGSVVDVSIEMQGYSSTVSIHWHPDSRRYPYVKLEEPVLWKGEQIRQWRVLPDYDLSTGSRPVEQGDKLFLLVIGFRRKNLFQEPALGEWTGLSLRQVSENKYERLGLCELPCAIFNPVRREASTRDNFEWRYCRQYIASLPIRNFKII